MGAWGTGLYQDDVAMDVRDTYKDQLHGDDGTFIPTIPLSFRQAIAYVRTEGNVFASTKNNAYKLAVAAGGGHPERDHAHGGIGYWRHYHATRSGKRIGGHIFYV